MMVLLFDEPGYWHRVKRCDARARALADDHYSRQTPGARDFMGNGKTLVLITLDELAVWGVIENTDITGKPHWRCSIFRNVGPTLSSDLIVEATERTYAFWARRPPSCPLTTEIDAEKVRHKRDPGRCFLKAGWTRIGMTAGGHGRNQLVVLQAPEKKPPPALARREAVGGSAMSMDANNSTLPGFDE